MTHADKLAAAIAYLRERNLYLLDHGNSFQYVPSERTDVRQTIGDERTCQRAPDADPFPFI